MNISVRAGRTYAVTTSAGCTVSTEDGQLLLTCEAGTQGVFVAPCAVVVVSDDAALVTESFKGASVGAASGGGVTEEEAQALIDDALTTETIDTNATQEGSDNGLFGWWQLGAAFVQSGTVSQIQVACRDTASSSMLTVPVYLAVWQLIDGSYQWVGTSTNGVTQEAGTTGVWEFDDIQLQSVITRFYVVTDPANHNEKRQSGFGARVSATDDADTYISGGSNLAFVPEAVFSYVTYKAKYAAADDLTALAETVTAHTSNYANPHKTTYPYTVYYSSGASFSTKFGSWKGFTLNAYDTNASYVMWQEEASNTQYSRQYTSETGDYNCLLVGNQNAALYGAWNGTAVGFYLKQGVPSVEGAPLTVQDATADTHAASLGQVKKTVLNGAYFLETTDITELPDTWDFSTAVSMVSAFQYCVLLTTFPDSFTLPACLTGSYAFGGCSALTGFPDGFRLDSLQNGYYMFQTCLKLTALPDGLTLPELMNASNMFYGCTSLTTIPAGGNYPKLSTGGNMFYNCKSLTGLPDTLDFPSLNSGKGMFAGCPSLTTDDVNKIFAALPDRSEEAAAGSSYTITVPNTDAANAADATVATGKGWTVAYA